jgi:pleiotropic regulator 1
MASLTRSEYGSVMHLPTPIATKKQSGRGDPLMLTQDGEGSKLVGAGAAPSPAVVPEMTSRTLALMAQTKKDKDALALRAPVMPKPKWHPKWKLMRVISGHLGWVRCIAVEPQNQWFATGAADRTIKIWDMASGTLKLSLTGHISTVRGLAISDRHPYMFSAGEDKEVKCWDLECNKVIRRYHGHLSAVHCIQMHPTLDVLMTGGRDASIRIWDMRTKSQVHCLTGHTSTVGSLLARSTDPQVVSGSHDNTVRLWDITAGKSMCTLTNHKKSIRALAHHPKENTFASGAPDNIKQWYAEDGKFIQNLSGHNAVINTLACNADGVLVSGADNGTLSFWDYRTGYRFQQSESLVQPGSLDSEAGIFASAFDKSGSRFITCEADKTIKVYKEDANSSEETDPVDWKPTIVRKARF